MTPTQGISVLTLSLVPVRARIETLLASRTVAAAALQLSLVAGAVPAQVVWTQRSPAAGPLPRFFHAMAHDQARHRVVLFGGHGNLLGCGLYGDTWEWDGASWTELFPASSPSPRTEHVMAYCPARGRVVLFGGSDCRGPLSDTWEWDGRNWIQSATPVAPSDRFGSAMALAPGGNVLLFGGYWYQRGGHPRYFGDTWEWNGQWVQRSPARTPAKRGFHHMTFDARSGRVVLHGGAGPESGNAPFNDTWEWDGNDWTERHPTSVPSLYGQPSAMVYDGDRDRVVLYLFKFSFDSEVWEWDGAEWVLRSPPTGPPGRYGTAMVYDWLHARSMLFGGQGRLNYSDTWEYYTRSPASYAAFGTGCTGSAGTPALGLGGQLERPWAGSTITVAVSNLPPGNGTAIVLGASSSQWGAVTLPFDLSGVGMPGCKLYSSAEVALPLANGSGTASLNLPIPNSAALVGGVFYNQALALDPPANPLGVIWSNAGAGTVGAR